jgi:hypothetical protein
MQAEQNSYYFYETITHFGVIHVLFKTNLGCKIRIIDEEVYGFVLKIVGKENDIGRYKYVSIGKK